MSYTPTEWTAGDTITAEKLNKVENGIKSVNDAYTPTEWATGDTITAEKLNKIESGIANAQSVEVESLSVTANGTYTAEAGKAYSPVSVAVPNSYAAADEGKVVSNGALVAQTSDSVTENGTVDTTLINSLTVNVPQGGGEVEEKDVNFIDYDGTILYSYTAQEFAALDALPALVSHDGMAAATAWNWTLAEAKAQVLTSGELLIGQEYAATQIDFELSDKAKSPTLQLAVNGSVKIDWGDGNYTTATGSSISTRISKDHTYSSGGKYTITITKNNDTTSFALCASASTEFLLGSTDSSLNGFYSRNVTAIRLSGETDIGQYAFYRLYGLSAISLPRGIVSLPKGMIAGYGLKKLSLPNGITDIGELGLGALSSLPKLVLPNGVLTFGKQAIYSASQLKKLTIPASVTTMGSQALAYLSALSTLTMLPETPPTILSDTLSSTFSNTIIYVPHGKLAAYQAAQYWSSRSSYMVELPE